MLIYFHVSLRASYGSLWPYARHFDDVCLRRERGGNVLKRGYKIWHAYTVVTGASGLQGNSRFCVQRGSMGCGGTPCSGHPQFTLPQRLNESSQRRRNGVMARSRGHQNIRSRQPHDPVTSDGIQIN